MIRLHAVRNMAGEMGQISNMTSRYFAPMNIKNKRDRPTILLVEDSPTQRIVVSKMIQELGFNILGAGDGKEALHMALQHQPALILMDFDLPLVNGLDAAKNLRNTAATSHIPVVALTGCDSQACRLRALMRGVVDYIVKPVAPEQLHSAITEQI